MKKFIGGYPKSPRKTLREKNIEEFGTGTVKGIVCNKCGTTLPEILAVDHLDPEFSVNKCPHTPVYTIERGKLRNI